MWNLGCLCYVGPWSPLLVVSSQPMDLIYCDRFDLLLRYQVSRLVRLSDLPVIQACSPIAPVALPCQGLKLFQQIPYRRRSALPACI